MSWLGSSNGGDTLMSSPTVEEASYPELFALDDFHAGEEVARQHNQTFQPSMPPAPTLHPAPLAASWRQMNTSTGRHSSVTSDRLGTSVSSVSSTSDAGSWITTRSVDSQMNGFMFGNDFDVDPRLVQPQFASHQFQPQAVPMPVSVSIPVPAHQNHHQGYLQLAPAMHRRTSSSSISSQSEYASDAGSISDLGGYDFGFGGSFGGNANTDIAHQLSQQAPGSQGHHGRSVSHCAGTMAIDPNMFRAKGRAVSLSGNLAVDTSSLLALNDISAEDLETAKPQKKASQVQARSVQPARASNSPTTGSDDDEENDPSTTGKRGKKSSHARKQKPNHIPRPRNAFILFRKHVVDSKLIPPSVEMRHQNVSVIVAKMWVEASAEQKEQFNELAKIEKEEHAKKYPGYRYQPVYRRTNVIRRRVRKDEAEEEKCRSVAELLMKGKSGEELEEEIKEKMAKDQAEGIKAKNLQKSIEANELSKGALRALKAQAKQRQNRTSPDWTDASVASSRQASMEPDSSEVEDDESSMPHDRHDKLVMGYLQNGHSVISGTGRAQQQVLHNSQQLTNQQYLSNAFGQPGLSYNGVAVGAWPPSNQTYAYPETSAYPHNSHFAYRQPAQGEFYAYDQALPFSPTAHAFAMSQTQLPQSNQTRFSQPALSVEKPLSDQLFNRPHSHSQARAQPAATHNAFGSGGLDSTLPVPPLTARWNTAFGMDGEVMGFDDAALNNTLLQDFGSALTQAEEVLSWA